MDQCVGQVQSRAIEHQSYALVLKVHEIFPLDVKKPFNQSINVCNVKGKRKSRQKRKVGRQHE